MNNPIESRQIESDQVESPVEKFDSVSLERRIKNAQPANDQVEAVINIPLDRINPTDIQTGNDFNDPEQYAALHREVTMLGQMQPALEQGAREDTFDAWDKANQIGQYSPERYIRGYSDVYHSCYGKEAIALERKPNGTFDVINGRHRIAAAREAGLTRIPAKLVG